MGGKNVDQFKLFQLYDLVLHNSNITKYKASEIHYFTTKLGNIVHTT
jgi:hypothetical protein